MKLRTADGQEFDAWVNHPDNDRKIPSWLGTIGEANDQRTNITAPDGSTLTVGAGDVVVNQHGRLTALSMRNARRLADIVEGEEETEGPQRVHIPAQDLNVGRARQGMVTSDRGRLQPDDPIASRVSDGSGSAAASAGDSGAAGGEQVGSESAGESAGGDPVPAEATATGGPGQPGAGDPIYGAVGSAGDVENAGDPPKTEDDADAESDGGEEQSAVTPRRRKSHK